MLKPGSIPMPFAPHAQDPFLIAVIESIEDYAIFTVDHAGYLTHWNPGAERITGYAADEVIGKHVATLTSPEEAGDDYEKVLRVAARVGRLELEREWVRRDGTAFRGFGRITAIRGERGELLGFGAVLRDLGELPSTGEAPGEEARHPYESLFSLHPDGVASLDLDARFVRANPAWEALSGIPLAELAGTPLLSLVAAEDRRRVMDAFRQASRGEAQRLETAVLPREGERTALDLTCIPRRSAGAVVGVFVIARDVTPERLQDQELRRSEAFFRMLVEESEQVFFYTRDATGFRYLSPSLPQVLGYRPRELAGVPFSDLLADPGLQELSPEGAARPSGMQPFTLTLRHRDGRPVVLELVESETREGDDVCFQGFARDVTRRTEREEQLLRNALRDAQTGLPSRAVFLDRLEHAARRAERRTTERFAVLLVDLDRFGVVDDSLGREVSDALLADVGRRMRRCIRPADTLCRLDGDEFGLVLEGLTGAGGATRVAERIQNALAFPFRIRSHELFIGASIGVAMCQAKEDPEEILRHAHSALRRVRARGGSGYEVFGNGQQEMIRSRLELEGDLRRAVERDELALVYQPVVSLKTGDISAFEALVRWRHPSRGTISPAEFLPLAEDTGLILGIGRWVLREACEQIRAWREEYPDRECRVSINLSGREIAAPDTVERIRGALEESRIPPSSLEVEVREDAIIAGAELSGAVLRRIQDLGVQIQVDDFGTGTGSLTHLHRSPARTLKVDQAMLEGDGMMRAAVGMAHILDLLVVAEGIETTEQLDRLRALDCDYGQGYLFSEPVDGELAGLLLSRRLPL